jgi:hypothetical protein
MFTFKKSRLTLALAMIVPVSSFASSHYCIEVGGGFGKGGTTFIGTGFAVPAEGTCSPWAGFTKTASSVILMTSGTGCLSSDGKVLTVSVASADPAYFGSGTQHSDYIQVCPSGIKSCPLGGSGRDSGEFGGSAEPISCTSSLESLPAIHD